MKSSQQLRLEMCWSKNRVAEKIIKCQQEEIKKKDKRIKDLEAIIEEADDSLNNLRRMEAKEEE